MFCSGAELRSPLGRAERRVLGIAVAGNVVPFLAGLAFVAVYDTSRSSASPATSSASPLCSPWPSP